MTVVLILIAMFVWGGCGASTTPHPAVSTLPVAQDVSAPDLKRAMESDDSPLVIDVRTPAEYAAGHIPGAVNIPVANIEKHRDDLPKDRRLVLY